MALGKQAKALSKGQVEAVLGYLATTRWPGRNRLIPAFRQGRSQGQRDSPPDLVDDERLPGRHSPNHVPPRFGQQRKVRQDDPP